MHMPLAVQIYEDQVQDTHDDCNNSQSLLYFTSKDIWLDNSQANYDTYFMTIKCFDSSGI